MRLERLRAFALTLPGASVRRQWGDNLVFKVGGKIFLIFSIEAESLSALSFKCPPAEFSRLTREVDGIIPAPYLARASWVMLEDPAALPEPEVCARIRTSYELVRAALPKKVQAAL